MWLLVFDVAYQAWLLHLIKILFWSSLHWHSTVKHSPEWLSRECRLVGVHFLAVVSNSVTVHILTSARVWGFSVRTGNWLSQHRPLSCDSVQIAHVEFKCMQICDIFHSSLFFMSPSQRQLGICSDDKFPFASRKNDSELLIKSTSWHARKTLWLFRPCLKPQRQESNKEDNLMNAKMKGGHILAQVHTPCSPLPHVTPTHPSCPRLAHWGDLTWICACLGRNHLLARFFFLDGKKKATVVIPSGQLSQTPTVVIRSGQLSQTQSVFPTLGPSGSWASWQAALFSTGLWGRSSFLETSCLSV